MAQPDAIAWEVHTDCFPLLSADHGECAAPVLLTISIEVIRIAVGALRASVTSTAVFRTEARKLRIGEDCAGTSAILAPTRRRSANPSTPTQTPSGVLVI